MNLTKFLGIRSYHDGSYISDYCNTIPLGSSVIDRLGEELIRSGTGTPRASFVDSLGNVYIVIGTKIYRYHWTGYGFQWRGAMEGRYHNDVITDWNMKNASGNVTFCESSTKPSQVYMCDGEYIYQWNTVTPDYGTDVAPWVDKFIVRMVMSPDIYPTRWGDDDYKIRVTIDDADLYYILENPSSDEAALFDLTERVSIDSITWFDNKLIAIQGNANTVWLTATDPGQFQRYTGNTAVVGYGTIKADADTVTYNILANPQWGISYADTEDTGTIYSALWHSWYSSTNSADRLNTAIGFNGLLYLINNTTIEPWSRTGDEDAPIQNSALNTIYHGGSKPIIIANTLFLICKDRLGKEFIGALQGTTLTRISNEEIEKRLNSSVEQLYAITMREETFLKVVVSDTDSYCYGRDSTWWRWHDPLNVRHIVNSIYNEYAIANDGSLMQFNSKSRTYSNGAPIVRYVRDFFMHYAGRKICRSVELVMDTGIAFTSDSDRNIYCRISSDRGHNFGPYLYRRLGTPGDNDRVIIWRNLGSGNSFLLEFGTSANYQFQIYQVNLQIA